MSDETQRLLYWCIVALVVIAGLLALEGGEK